jgi:hypothetical protein
LNEGIGLNISSTSIDTLKLSTILGANSIIGSKDADSTLRLKLVNDTTFTPTASDYLYGWSYRRGAGALGYMNKISLSGQIKTLDTIWVTKAIVDSGDLRVVQSGSIYQQSSSAYSTGGYQPLVWNQSTGRYEVIGADQKNQLAHSIFTPTTGGTVNTVVNQYNIINPAGSLLALTVNLPSSPSNNDMVYIKYTQSITTVTYANGTVVDGITSPIGGGLVILVYDAGTTSWY